MTNLLLILNKGSLRCILVMLLLLVGCEDAPTDSNDSNNDNEGQTDIYGCMDENACNFDPSATIHNNYCDYPENNTDCNGDCTNWQYCLSYTYDCSSNWSNGLAGPMGSQCYPSGVHSDCYYQLTNTVSSNNYTAPNGVHYWTYTYYYNIYCSECGCD